MQGDFGAGKYLGVAIFALAFGYAEAAVVIYLRAAFGIEGASLFPLTEVLPGQGNLLMRVEAQREAATLIILLVAAMLTSARTSVRALAFCYLFGIWDLAYYAGLFIHLRWPPSLLTYDVLFLLPTVWVSPVLCPVLVSVGLVAFATSGISLSQFRRVPPPTLLQFVMAAGGAGLMLYTFMGPAPHYLAGGMPLPFGWWWFLLGYGLAFGAGGLFLFRLGGRAKRVPV